MPKKDKQEKAKSDSGASSAQKRIAASVASRVENLYKNYFNAPIDLFYSYILDHYQTC